MFIILVRLNDLKMTPTFHALPHSAKTLVVLAVLVTLIMLNMQLNR